MSKNIGKLKISKSLENKLSSLFTNQTLSINKKNENVIGTNVPPIPPTLPKSNNLELPIKNNNKNKTPIENIPNILDSNIKNKSKIIQKKECKFYLKCSDKTFKHLINKVFYKEQYQYENKKDIILIISGIFIGIIIRLSIF